MALCTAASGWSARERPPAAADAQRAAMQCSLLRDFVSDAHAGERRRRCLPADERAARRRAWRTPPSRSWCERRSNASTRAPAARWRAWAASRTSCATPRPRRAWRWICLRRRGATAESRAGRLLETSLSALQRGIEDALLDEALSAGGLRTYQRSLSADARARAVVRAGAGRGGQERPRRLSDAATPAEGEGGSAAWCGPPSVASCARAARRASRAPTIRLETDARRRRRASPSRSAPCRKLPGNRLPDLPALALARRAAKANGGSLARRDAPRRRLRVPPGAPRRSGHR